MGRPRKWEMWQIINAILYVVRTGCQWLKKKQFHRGVKVKQGCLILLLLCSLLIAPTMVVRAQELPVVHAVLFYSPNCGHCHYVMTETLPPLTEKYGSQLQIVGVNITQQNGYELFLAALQKFGLESGGVPFLVIGDIYLVGSADIPAKLPGLIESCLASGGVDWPDIPGLREALDLSSQAETATADAQSTTPEPAATVQPALLPTATPGIPLPLDPGPSNWRDRFALDSAGNTLSVIVLIGMLLSVAWTVHAWRRESAVSLSRNARLAIPILCALGFGVAAYLAYVETAQATAVCGPVGDCNTVQQSEYARLFGIRPIGVLGLVGYALIFLAWLFMKFARKEWLNDILIVFLFAMGAFGTLFSIYLTFLEPFVIGATCAWCLTSALIMDILLLILAKPAKFSYLKLMRARSSRRRRT